MALGDVRVLDLTRVIAGPFCTTLLADLGAEVIKVELPGRGDDARYGYPKIKNVPVMFLAMNRNKKGITIDLRKPEGKALLRRLVPHCDILVENFAPGTMAAWDLGYESLRSLNPRLIYGALSGFGQTGPYSGRTSYDIIAQAMGGLMALTGFEDGPPIRGGGSLGDFIGGTFLAVALLGALHHRDRTGAGQFVDVSNMDAIFSMLDGWPTIHALSGRKPPRLGNRHPFTAPYDCYRAKDGHLVIGVGNSQLFAKLAGAMGKADLASDPRFKSAKGRLEHHEQINRIVGEWVAQHTVNEVMNALGPDGANIPCAPVMTVDRLVRDPQIAAREMLVELEHPSAGHIPIWGIPFKLSGTPGRLRHLGPELGQHTDEVLKELLGMSDPELERLRDQQVI